MSETANPEGARAEVFYNGACPICSAEMEHYRGYAEARDLPLAFLDLNEADLDRFGLTADEAAKRLYVVKDGALLSGMEAFRALWSEMPRYRLLARLFGLPGVRQVAALLYDRVVAPALYARHRRREARKARAA